MTHKDAYVIGGNYLVHDGNGEVRLLWQGGALGTKLTLSQKLLASDNDT